MEIVDRVEVVKSEHEKLEGGNKFLQSYVAPSSPTTWPYTDPCQIYWRAHANQQAHLRRCWKGHKGQGQGQAHQITIRAPPYSLAPCEPLPCRSPSQSSAHHGLDAPTQSSLPRNHDGLLPHILTTMTTQPHTHIHQPIYPSNTHDTHMLTAFTSICIAVQAWEPAFIIIVIIVPIFHSAYSFCLTTLRQ